MLFFNTLYLLHTFVNNTLMVQSFWQYFIYSEFLESKDIFFFLIERRLQMQSDHLKFVSVGTKSLLCLVQGQNRKTLKF